MGADKLAENTPNAPTLLVPICLPKPKILGFFLLVSAVRGLYFQRLNYHAMDRIKAMLSSFF